MNPHISISAEKGDNWKEKTAKVGHYAKGAVYGIAGVLTLLSALNMGGQKAGKTQVIDFLQKQAFGNVLLILMAIGLACYAFWRFLQSFQDLNNEGDDFKAKAVRTGYFISGILYLSLGGYAVSQLFGSGGSGGGSSKQGMVAKLLQSEAGTIVVICIAIALFAKALYQFYRVYKGDFTKHIHSGKIPYHKAQSLIKKAGYAGFTSRGILIAIVGYFFLQAALHSNAGEIQGSSGAFSFIQQSTSGPWLMALVAFGLVCYGVFMMVKATYKRFVR